MSDIQLRFSKQQKKMEFSLSQFITTDDLICDICVFIYRENSLKIKIEKHQRYQHTARSQHTETPNEIYEHIIKW